MTQWTDRVGRESPKRSATVDALLASLTRENIKYKNLEAVRVRTVEFEGFHTIDFGAIQLREETIRAIARECRVEKLLKTAKKKPGAENEEHIAVSRITPPFGQLYTEADESFAGTRVDIKQLKSVTPEHLRRLAHFMGEIGRLHDGIVAFADENPAVEKPSSRTRRSAPKGQAR